MIQDTNGDVYIKRTKELIVAWATRLFLTLVVAPVSIWLLTRIVTTADDIQASVHAHDTSLEVLKMQGAEIKDLVSDHETRIRTLERRPTFAPR